jgi:hypothetical protein
MFSLVRAAGRIQADRREIPLFLSLIAFATRDLGQFRIDTGGHHDEDAP